MSIKYLLKLFTRRREEDPNNKCLCALPLWRLKDFILFSFILPAIVPLPLYSQGLGGI